MTDSEKQKEIFIRAMNHPHFEDWPPWKVARAISWRDIRATANDVRAARKMKGIGDYENKPRSTKKKEPPKNEISQLIAGWGR